MLKWKPKQTDWQANTDQVNSKPLEGISMKVVIVFAINLFILTACFPSYYPEDIDSPGEMTQGAIGSDIYDEWKESQWDQYAEEAEREYEEYQADNRAEELEELDNGSNEQPKSDDGCPYGCETHKAGCDIKGNISVDSGEKIYHLPGQKFYKATNIRPEYGERWFCTEKDARANGWRKSKK